MKIFSWVHRRFNNKENAKKNGDIAADDKQFQLVENKCDVLERWRGGILTIGTFGYDPLKDQSEQINDVCNYLYEDNGEFEIEQYESRDDVTDSEEEVENSDDYDYDNNNNNDNDNENPLVYGSYEMDLEDLMEENRWEEFGFDYVMMEKKARTTLADLFNADSDDTKKQPIIKGELTKGKPKCKHGIPFRKKLMLQDARPIRKLHRLIRRMLKRKIHPDISSLNCSKVPVARKCDTNDHASLLPTQDAII